MLPTNAFATATQRKILRVLAEKNSRYTLTELAEMCHRTEATISRALRHVDRYPFIEKRTVPGAKQLTFRLDPESQYAAAIRNFFGVEYDRERQNRTIPVDVWNLLEDVTAEFEDEVDGFVELFLFGSYATGDYYAKSDIDRLLIHTMTVGIKEAIDRVIEKVGDDRLQVLSVQLLVPRSNDWTDENILDTIREQSPVGGTEVLVPLSGEVAV